MLQGITSQTVPNYIDEAQFVNIVPLLAVGALALVLISGCAILLHRTSAGMKDARFLRHLAFAFAINAANAFVSIVYFLLRAALAFFAIQEIHAGRGLPQSFIDGFEIIKSAHHGLTMMISLLSNVFLFAAWDLLRRFPNQGVRKSFYTALMTFFGSGSILILVMNMASIFEKAQKHFLPLLDSIDLGTSAVGLLLIGWQLQKTLAPRIKKYVWRVTLPWLTLMAYWVWAGSQLVHHWLRWKSWYVTLLLSAALFAAISTIVLCSQALDEKPEYSST